MTTSPTPAPGAPSPTVLTDADGNAFELRPKDCPTCGPGPQTPVGLRGGRHHRYRLGVETPIVRCTRCGLLFPNPFPYPRDPQKLYGDPDQYFIHHDPSDKIAMARSVVREAVRRVGRPRIALLDVGSGRGEVLHAAAGEGCEAVGLELSESMIAEGRRRYGVEIVPETVEQYAAHVERTFDAVLLCAVIEHVYDPDSMMAAVARLTRPGSWLHVDVPQEPNLLTIVGNAYNRVRRDPAVYNLQPTWPPFHVFGFNPRALRMLLEKHGFVIESLRIHAVPRVPARDDWRDRIRALVATQVNRVANWTGTAANMYVWAWRR